MAVVLLAGRLGAAPSGPSTSKDAVQVLAVMERVADWQLANPTKWKPTEWHPAAFYTGLLALADLSSSSRFHDAMVRIAERSDWKLGPRPYDADDHCVGQAYAELFLRHHEPRMIAGLQERFDYILAHRKETSLEFDRSKNPDRKDRWSWSDSLFMGPPTWIRLYAATGNKAYLDFMLEEWAKTSAFLYDKDEHLFYRDSTYFAQHEANQKKVFWGRGNGWVVAGIVRVLQYLPKDHPARAQFVKQLQEISERVLALQQDDGLWRASLLDPQSYPSKETSGSGFFCYAFAWGINQGVLDRARFTPAVDKAWSALVACVKEDGKLTHVQPVGATPKTFDPDATEVYGVGAFLLAGSEVYRLRSDLNK
jgi:unsaturated rhamnogalacturonyl hydrolase